ncbi:MAG: hypothetical protein JSW34_04190, partial [Candidatus Zixiibacteriota bacterium]
MRRILLFWIGTILTNTLVSPASARVALCGDSSKTHTVYAVDDDYSYDYAFHTVGNLVLSVTNIGVWGESAYLWPDYFTG